MRWAALLVAALVVSGCQTAGQQASPAAPPPTDYRKQVADYMRRTFKDPYSIRDASISAPIPGTSMMGAMYTVCVRANAKNSFGGYTGLKFSQYTFRDGRITLGDERYAAITCDGQAYEPFPEIEAGRRS